MMNRLIPFLVVLSLVLAVALIAPPKAQAAVTYDRAAAIAWAQANNRNDQQFYGYSQGRWCTNYIARALNAGGLNVPTSWIGNNQIISWMLNNPNDWEFRPLDQLIGGDIVLYSDQPEAPSDWAHFFSNGASRWGHSALVIAPGRVGAWNAEYWDLPIGYVTTMPYRLGVHIKDESGPPPTDYQHQGSLSYGATQVRNLNGEHRWHIRVQSNHAPIMFDLGRRSGNGSYRVILKNASGAWLVETRASVNGRAIVSYPTPANEDLYLHVIPDDGVNLDYSVTAWATSIPRIAYEWEYQDAYYDSNTSRWQAYVGNNPQDFYVNFERYAGDLEFQWRLQTRGGTVLATGSSADGRVVAPGRAAGWVDFYITSATGSGSYRISLRNGVPNPGIPRILTPGVSTVVGRNFTVTIQPGPGNGRGTPDWHVQIDDNADFSSPEFDNAANWSRSTEIPVQLIQPGEYFVRVRQGDGIDRASDFTEPMRFTVESTSAFGLKAVTPNNMVAIGGNLRIDFVLEHPELAPGGGVYAVEAVCRITPDGVITAQSIANGVLFAPDPAIVSPGIETDNSFLYAISQSGENPAITEQGIVFSLDASGQQPGEATLTCNAIAIDANNTEVAVPFTSLQLFVEEPAPTTGIVAGTVQRSHAHDENITVELTSNAGDVIATTTTQADGSFAMPDILEGNYTVRAVTGGYLAAQGTVRVVAGETATMPALVLLAGDIATGDPMVIDELDVVQLAANYNQQVPPASADADLTLDNVVGLPDLRALAENLRETGPINWR